MPWYDGIGSSFWKLEQVNGTCDNSTLNYAPAPNDTDLYDPGSCCIEGGKPLNAYWLYSFILPLNAGGCPIFLQDWCGSIPGLTSAQLVIGFILIVTGYPMGSAMSNAIYSKVIGPHPQVFIHYLIRFKYF